MPVMIIALYGLLIGGTFALGYGGSPLTAFFNVVLLVFLIFARERLALLIQVFFIVAFMCAAGDLIANMMAAGRDLADAYYIGIGVGGFGHAFGLLALTRPSVKAWLKSRESDPLP